MKVNKEDFYKILNTVKIGLSKSKSLESMLYFQFTGESIMAYNNEILITYKFKTDFSCFVHANNLMKTINKIKSTEIDISIVTDKFIIKTPDIQLKLNTIIDDEIPLRTNEIIKSIDKCKWYKLPSNFFDCIKLCQFAASKKESDKTLTCININKTIMISSDNNRVAKAILSKKMKSMLIQSDHVSTIINLNLLKYDITKSWIHFKEENDNFILSVRRISGNYPDFSDIIDSLEGDKVELSKDILDGLDISEVFVDEFNSSIIITVKKNICIIKAKADSGSMQYRTKTEYNGKDFTFSVNPSFLKEMLKHSSILVHSDTKISITNGDFTIVTALFEE